MKIATSSQVVFNLPVVEAVDALAATGYEGLELWAEHVWRDGVSPAALRRRTWDAGLALSVHAPIRDLNLTSSNAGIRDESMRQSLESLDLAAELGVRVVTFHPGRLSSEKDGVEGVWRLQLEVFARLARRAETLGLRLGIENMERRPRELVVLPEDVDRILREVGSPALGFTLDLAHAATLPGVDLDAFAARCAPVYGLHISDCNATSVHLPLGTGHVDLAPALVNLAGRFDGLAVVEGYQPGREMEVLRQNIVVAREIVPR